MGLNYNLFSALRAAFPKDLDATAIETADAPLLCYSWRDLDNASARIANLLDSLGLPAGARVAAQTEKSVEALMLYLAVLRAGFVYLPLNTAYTVSEIEYFIGNAEPSVVVCSGKNFSWVSRTAFKAGTEHVFTLNEDRSGSLLERAAPRSDVHTPAHKEADELAAILYTSGTTGRSKGTMLSHGSIRSNALTLKDLWGWQDGDVLIHALIDGSKMSVPEKTKEEFTADGWFKTGDLGKSDARSDVSIVHADDFAATNSACPRCGAAFHCRANDAVPCACGTVKLDETMQKTLRDQFASCLCLGCLRQLATGEPTVAS